MKNVAITVLAVSLLTITGCNSHAGSKADGTPTASGSTGDTTTVDDQVPKNLPAYSPVYAGAKGITSVVTGNTGVLNFVVPDKPAAVVAYYEKIAAANHLSSKVETPADDDGSAGAMLSQPGTQRSLTVAARPADDGQGTKVSLSYGAP